MSSYIKCPNCGKDGLRIFKNGVILVNKVIYSGEETEPTQQENCITNADMFKCDKCESYIIDGYGITFQEAVNKFMKDQAEKRIEREKGIKKEFDGYNMSRLGVDKKADCGYCCVNCDEMQRQKCWEDYKTGVI